MFELCNDFSVHVHQAREIEVAYCRFSNFVKEELILNLSADYRLDYLNLRYLNPHSQ
ncbi:hypothetical protein D3C78_1946750 [compost metagenome]